MRLELVQRHYVPDASAVAAEPLWRDKPQGGLAEIRDAFGVLQAWDERYQYIIDLGYAMPKLLPEFCVEAHRLHGCQSQVWLVINRRAEKLFLHAASDAVIVNGLIALMVQVYSGRTAAEILAINPDFIDDLGLGGHLSPLRKNGLFALVEAVQTVAQYVEKT